MTNNISLLAMTNNISLLAMTNNISLLLGQIIGRQENLPHPGPMHDSLNAIVDPGG